MHAPGGLPRQDASCPANRGWWIAAACIAAAGAAIRLMAARGDLWLDEIWSLVLAREAGSIPRILLGIHHDNNHYLNTLWMHLLGEPASALAYRLPSIAAGTGTIALVALRPLRHGRIEALTTAVLVAVCPLLVQYDSEARGYALAAFFAVAGFFTLDSLLTGSHARRAAAFALCATLGILSHLTFFFVLAGFGTWAALDVAIGRRRRADAFALGTAFVPPLIVSLVLWWIDWRHIVIGGGPATTIFSVLREWLRSVFALPSGVLELLAIPALALAGAGLARLAEERDPRGAFFAVAIFVAPAIVLIVDRPQVLAPRYFFLAVPFLLMLVGHGLCALSSRWRAGFRAHPLLVVLYCAASAVPNSRLAAVGRGGYSEAIAFMRAATPEATVTVGTDNDFRNGMILDHGTRFSPGEKPFELVPKEAWPGRPPRWFLIHDLGDLPSPPPAVEVWSGRPYTLAASFPKAGLSGWHWYVLERRDATPR